MHHQKTIFPRYFCALAAGSDGVTIEQLKNALYVSYTPDQVFDIKEFNRVLESELDEIELQVIHARFYQNESLRQITSYLNVSDETVRSVEARALRKLRRNTSRMRDFAGTVL